MQTDMHYYGTYAMARAAGLHLWAAETIATAAEYVDDSDTVGVKLSDGAFLEASATAHHPANTANFNAVDQRKIWVPFHFIPGNEGETFEERLICRKDSLLARQVLEHHLALQNTGCPLELMGVTAHAYADTFSHYGFSGIASTLNHVHPKSIKLDVADPGVLSYIMEKAGDFEDKYLKGEIADLLGLGHGSVATYPDRPYLSWSFTYESTQQPSGQRVNQFTFLEACEKLHGLFCNFGDANPELTEPGSRVKFPTIEAAVKKILAVEGKMDARSHAWKKAALEGALFAAPAAIPDYKKAFPEDIALLQAQTLDTVGSTSGYAFLKAAKIHRDYMLDELLPQHGLHVLHRT